MQDRKRSVRGRRRATSPDETAPAHTRQRILEIALDLFTRQGYAETSLRQIAEAVGVSKAALYYYFESKDDILLALHMRVHDLMEELFPLISQAGEGDPWQRVVDAVIDIALANRPLIELHLRNAEAFRQLEGHVEGPKNDQANAALKEQLVNSYVSDLMRDQSVGIETRARMVASLGAIGAVLLASPSLGGSNEELRVALRSIVRDVLRGRG